MTRAPVNLANNVALPFTRMSTDSRDPARQAAALDTKQRMQAEGRRDASGNWILAGQPKAWLYVVARQQRNESDLYCVKVGKTSNLKRRRTEHRADGWGWFIASWRIKPDAKPSVDKLEEMAIELVRSRWEPAKKKSCTGFREAVWADDPRDVAEAVDSVIPEGARYRGSSTD